MTLLISVAAAAQDIKLGVTYVCNGEPLYVQGCDIDDKSDSAPCTVAYPERPKRAGLTVPVRSTRGELKKLLPTCTQPSAANVEAKRKFDEGVRQKQQQALAEQEAYRRAHENNVAPQPKQKGANQIATEQCIASGRSAAECLARAIQVEASGTIPGLAPKQVVPGLRFSGRYRGPRIMLNFPHEIPTYSANTTSGHVNVACGELVSKVYGYQLVNDGAVTLKIFSSPPLTFSMQPDHSLVGPAGLQTMNGEVVVGHTTTTERQWKQDPMTYGKPVGQQTFHWEDVKVDHPITRPGTDRCDFSRLVLTGPEQLTPAEANSKGATELLGAALQEQGTAGSRHFEEPPGLRLAGEYAGGGVKIEFRGDSATVTCGDVAITDAYAITPERNAAVIKLPNGGSSFTLALRPAGELTGAGTLVQRGKVMTGFNADHQVTYAPKATQCQLGTLRATPTPTPANSAAH